MVWILLMYEAWRAKGKSFTLSNIKLARYGINREMKRQALAELEAAGLITVTQQGRQSPSIKMVPVSAEFLSAVPDKPVSGSPDTRVRQA
jgi:hypothetical protein